jgi:hypothetical protein
MKKLSNVASDSLSKFAAQTLPSAIFSMWLPDIAFRWYRWTVNCIYWPRVAQEGAKSPNDEP